MGRFEELKKMWDTMGGRSQIPVNKIFPDPYMHRARMHRFLNRDGEMLR